MQIAQCAGMWPLPTSTTEGCAATPARPSSEGLSTPPRSISLLFVSDNITSLFFFRSLLQEGGQHLQGPPHGSLYVLHHCLSLSLFFRRVVNTSKVLLIALSVSYIIASLSTALFSLAHLSVATWKFFYLTLVFVSVSF